MAKKKPTHQEKSTNQQDPNPKMEPNNQPPAAAAAIEDSAEKLSSLKSLNSMLLKETVEKRQEVSALLESKKSLESELTRSESQVEALRAELAQMQAASEAEVLRRENEELRREKEGVEKRLEDVEREMGEVVRERDEMEKAKFEGDLRIGSLKKLENELRGEIKQGREALNQVIHEKGALKQDLAVRVEERNKLMGEMEAKERNAEEELRKLKSKYEVVANVLKERDNEIKSMRTELSFVGRKCEELKREIEGLNGEKEFILREKLELSRERSEQDVKINELEKEVHQLNVVVLSLREDEEKWRVKFFELERSNAEMVGKIEELCRELDASMEEKEEKLREIEWLKGEESRALDGLAELEKELEAVKGEREEVLKEKNLLERVKSEQQSEINELQNEVNELQGSVSLLKKSNRDELEKNRQLFSEIDEYKTMLDRVKLERDDAQKTLEKEKANGMKLQVKVSEISKKMEDTAKVIEELRAMGDTLVAEKKELENKYGKLMEENSFAVRKFTDAQKTITELEATLKSKNDMFEETLAVLKKTALQLSMENEKKGGEEGVKKGEMGSFLEELEAINSAFRRREEKVGEMEKEMESLKWCVEEARKKKSFWALVSSATTILAAVVSFAYASRAH